MADVFYLSESEKMKGYICKGIAGANDFKCNVLQRCCENTCCFKDPTFPLVVLAIIAVLVLIAFTYRYCQADEKAKVKPEVIV